MLSKLQESKINFVDAAIRRVNEAANPVKRTDIDAEEGYKTLSESAQLSVSAARNRTNRNSFIQETKTAFLGELIYKLFNESLEKVGYNEAYISEEAKRKMVSGFIEDAGVNKLLREYKTKSLLLSEMASAVEFFTEKACKACDDSDESILRIDKDVSDDFFKELDMADFTDVTMEISGRVIDAVDDFINYNAQNKANIKEILQTTQQKIDASKKDSIKESYSRYAKQRITAIKQSQVSSVFNEMVKATSTNILRDDELRGIFCEGTNTINMDRVVESCKVAYAFLETLNTARLANIDEEYIDKMLKDMK